MFDPIKKIGTVIGIIGMKNSFEALTKLNPEKEWEWEWEWELLQTGRVQLSENGVE